MGFKVMQVGSFGLPTVTAARPLPAHGRVIPAGSIGRLTTDGRSVALTTRNGVQIPDDFTWIRLRNGWIAPAGGTHHDFIEQMSGADEAAWRLQLLSAAANERGGFVLATLEELRAIGVAGGGEQIISPLTLVTELGHGPTLEQWRAAARGALRRQPAKGNFSRWLKRLFGKGG